LGSKSLSQIAYVSRTLFRLSDVERCAPSPVDGREPSRPVQGVGSAAGRFVLLLCFNLSHSTSTSRHPRSSFLIWRFRKLIEVTDFFSPWK
jgi:hypothetical protein